MTSGSDSLNERLVALALYNILDTPVEQAFDDITRLASFALDMPIALVSLVEEHRQWFKSELGLGSRETPISMSVCAHAIRQADSIFEVDDLMLDSRFADSPLVTADPYVRFYAGAVLRTNSGVALGTICVLDRKPRSLTETQRGVLLGLARQTMAQLELRRALHQADLFRESQSRFMAIAGHDLRQPLQIVSASVEIAALKSDSPAVQKHLGIAQKAIARLGQGLDDLAGAASRDFGVTLPTRLVPIRVRDVFSSFDMTWLHQAGSKGLRLDVALSSAVVVSDERLLTSIVGNLVGNAIKYTRSGRILVGCRRRPAGLEICVYDTGIGISGEDQAVIFAPFKQVDASSEGIGLGLTLVRQATDLLGYRLTIASTVGRGTRFGVFIPSDRIQRRQPG